ncbi:MAG: ammonia-dependent NAD(+) synthetase [Candidatus Cohnella colombiensis]|uniref:NH(3)-dependent NAD(+) synthetase n=1 Tax=Candidatus Cohnella colombiensis TaxID=3121368 RepID=A0AA95JBK3_9BACL|nr:MAG: ammonia-dependent NAD(+) synthetase [Cohnella sp.]
MSTIQQQVATQLHVKSTINPEQEVKERVAFLQQYLLKTGAKGYVLGISGGQDSTLAGRLAQLAIEGLNADTLATPYTFMAVRLPYGVQHDEEDAQAALAFVNPDRLVSVNIKPAVDAAVLAFQTATGETLGDFHKGNIKARERMKVQYDLGAHYGLLVLGTDHAAEAITGFYTKHGDGACDVAPIYGLNKRQGRALLKYLGSPQALYEKKPTADLEDLKPGLADEDALGLTYEELDDYLELKSVTEQTRELIERRYKLTEHKRRGSVTLYDDWWKTEGEG